MFNWKKILGVLLCLVVICSMVIGAVSCDEDEEEEELSYTITKTATAVDIAGNGVIDTAGEIIEYTVEVENTGNTTITGVSVSDSLSITLTRQDDNPGNTDADLEEGETWVYNGSYTVQQSDLDAGSIENTATVSSNELGDKSDTEEVSCGTQTYKIGVILPLSGRAALSGEAFKLGIEYVIEEMEAEGALNGADIEVVWADDAADPSQAGTEMVRLMTVENVCAVLGPFLPHIGLAAIPYADTYKIPVVGICTTSPDLADLNLEYYRDVNTEAQPGDYSQAMVDFLKYCIDEYDMPHERIAVIWEDNATGAIHQEAIYEKLEEYSLDDNVVIDIGYDITATSYTPYALLLKAENPDALIGFTLPSSFAFWLPAMYEADCYPPFLVTGQHVNWTLYTQYFVSADIYNAVINDEHTHAFAGGALFADYPLDSVSTFAENYAAWIAAKGQPNYYEMAPTPIGAQVMYVLWEALEAAGEPDPEKINDAFQYLSIPDTSSHFILPTLRPAIEWNSDGTLKNYSAFITQRQDDVEVIVWPEDLASAEPDLAD